MSSQYLQPLLMEPVYKETIWGGHRLEAHYGKTHVPAGYANVAETWEVSTHPHGQSTIADGDFAGLTLTDYLRQAGPSVLGSHHHGNDLSVLIKYIDATDNLSIQVHPDDSYAHAHGLPSGKTEMWYIVDATPEAFIYYGFDHEISHEEFQARITANTLPEVLHRVAVQPGDSFFLPAGTLHAIGRGCLIAEIQQSSDTTYRIYDYGRRDAKGHTRELHVADALAVTHLTPPPAPVAGPIITLQNGNTSQTLVKCPLFQVQRLTLQQPLTAHVGPESFQVLMLVRGELQFRWSGQIHPLHQGQTLFLPANLGKYQLSGAGEILLTTV